VLVNSKNQAGHDVSYVYSSDQDEYEQQTFEDFKYESADDLFDVLGSRRSIRYFKPHRKVERWKIEMIFQAGHRSSRAINGSFLKAVAVERDGMDPETRDALKTPTNTSDLDMAPLYIFTYANKQAALGGPPRLKDLYDRGAFSPAIGWSHEFADSVVGETILKPMAGLEEEAIWIGSVEAAQSIANMLLMIHTLGLGACCKSFVAPSIQASLKVPDDFHPIWMILVGYPAEDKNAGGQRPRPPIEDDYFFGDFDTPFETTDPVTLELRRRRLLQRVAPEPWREGEVRAVSRSFGLPEE
jgi:nitroreductase